MLSKAAIKRILKNLDNSVSGVHGDETIEMESKDVVKLIKHLENELLPEGIETVYKACDCVYCCGNSIK